jgi:hypothetical protein
MGIIIDGNINVGSSGISISPIYIPPPVSFNFTFDQQYTETRVTIQSIGRFTSNPPFTPRSGNFIFNSTGTSINPVTFNFTASCPISLGENCDLYKNGVLQQESFFGFYFESTASLAFNPISVSANDTIQIVAYYVPN